MKALILNNIDHFLFIMLLISRIGDVVSTYLASPNLVLETNPIIRKLRWPLKGPYYYLNTYSSAKLELIS